MVGLFFFCFALSGGWEGKLSSLHRSSKYDNNLTLRAIDEENDNVP
jgi:hypothetical protein